LNQLQTNYPAMPLVLLDTGNFSDNPTEVGDLRTATLLQSMKKLGYKAINIGERDLTLGSEPKDALSVRLDRLYQSASELHLPAKYASMQYTLRGHLDIVRDRIGVRAAGK